MKEHLDNPIELMRIVDEHLIPKRMEKRMNGEVFTPMNIIKQMLDTLPKHVWSNPKLRWLDPANGIGNFMIAVYLRLMTGLEHSIPDREKRKQHILNKMLYMCELNSKNVFICRSIMDPRDKYDLNIHTGDSLTLDTERKWGVAKFNIIVGNPPYNKQLNREGASPLYHTFIERYIDRCNMLLFIVPSRWFSGGKGLDKFRKMMLARRDIRLIRHFDDAKEVFTAGVNIEGGVNYFLKDSRHSGKCKYNGNMIDLTQHDVLVDSKYSGLIEHMSRLTSLTTLYTGRTFGIESNDKRLVECKPDSRHIRCYVSQQKGFDNKCILATQVKVPHRYWKVVTAEANGKRDCFGNMFVASPHEVHTGSYISFRVTSREAGESLISFMRTKLANLMLSLRKNSQHINETVCKWIPLPRLDRKWSDTSITKYFKLTPSEIKLVDTAVLNGYGADSGRRKRSAGDENGAVRKRAATKRVGAKPNTATQPRRSTGKAAEKSATVATKRASVKSARSTLSQRQ